jgi:hypothetical protein
VALNLKVSANVKGAVRGLNKLQRESKKTGMSVDKLAVAGISAAAAYKALDLAFGALTAAMRASFSVIKQSTVDLAKHGDRMAKQARMVGVTAEEYQGFEFAANRAGTSVKHVSNGLKKLGRVMTDAQQGSQQLEETFDALGINIYNVDGTLRPMKDVFMELADVSSILGESAERTGVLMLLLGRSGTEMANLMEDGSEGINDLMKRLDDLGGIMSGKALDASEKYIDAQTDLEAAFMGAKMTLGEDLIPVLTVFTEALTDFIVEDFAGEFDRIGDALVDVITDDTIDAMMSFVTVAGYMVAMLKPLTLGLMSYGHVISAINQADWGLHGKSVEEMTRAWDTFSEARREAQSIDLSKIGAELEGLGERLKKGMAGLRAGGDPRGYGGSHRWMIEEAAEEAEAAAAKAAERQAILDRLAGRRADREAEADRKRRQRQVEADQRKADREYLASLAERVALRLKRIREFTDTFIREDVDALRRSFLLKEMAEGEFLDRSKKAQIAAAEEVARKKLEILHGARAEKLKIGEWDLASELEFNVLRNRVEGERQSAIREGMRETQEFLQEEQHKTTRIYLETADAIGNLFGTLSTLAMQAYEAGDEDAKKVAIAMFHISQAFALATATVNTAMAVTQALTQFPGPPVTIPQAIAAGAIGAAEIATIIGTSIQGIGDAGLTSETLKRAGMNNHSAIVMRNDETVLDPVGTRHITEMLAIQKAQMMGGGEGQTIRTTVELDGKVLGESVDNYLIRQQERGLPYTDRIRQEYV